MCDGNYFGRVRMKWSALFAFALAGLGWAQQFEGETPASVQDLPNAKAAVQVPGLEGENPKADL